MNIHTVYWECKPDQQYFIKVVYIISFPFLFGKCQFVKGEKESENENLHVFEVHGSQQD